MFYDEEENAVYDHWKSLFHSFDIELRQQVRELAQEHKTTIPSVIVHFAKQMDEYKEVYHGSYGKIVFVLQ